MLTVEQRAKVVQRGHRNARLTFVGELLTGHRIQHPGWDGHLHVIRELDDHAVGRIAPEPTDDRYVPLPTPILPRLRDYWRTHRSREWLFPAPTRRGLRHSLAHQGGPVTRSSLQSAFRRAVLKSGIAKHASVHTLRHSYASHLHAAGVSLRLIQAILGHQSLRTTQIYTHLTPDVQATLTDPLNQLMQDL